MAQKMFILNDKDNPVRHFRNEHRLSRKNLADLAGVSNSIVARVELGLINTLPPAFARAMSEYVHSHMLSEEDIHAEWGRWKYMRRQAIGHEIISTPWLTKDVRLTKKHFTEGYFRTLAHLVSGAETDYAVARTLSIHPVTWTQYLERGGGDAHDTVLTTCIEDILFAVNDD